MAQLGREQVAFASEKYGSDPIEGLTVWGKWDSELYVMHNEDVEGEHGWQHFRSESKERPVLVHTAVFCIACHKHKALLVQVFFTNN